MKKHRLEKRIYYHDTDSGGVVYYANYLEHLEEGRTEFLRSIGVDTGEYAKNGILFPIVHISIDYKSPARYSDLVQVHTFIEKVGNASVHFGQEIGKGDVLLITAKTVWACVDAGMKPKPVPEEIRQKLAAWQASK